MGKTILIVEDEQNIVDILSFNLSREGYDTLEAYDGPTGLQLALEQDPDLILLDLMLPGMDGFECVPQGAGERLLPIYIMLTAREEETDKVLGLELGADDYITKPFSMRELLARVNQIRRWIWWPPLPGAPACPGQAAGAGPGDGGPGGARLQGRPAPGADSAGVRSDPFSGRPAGKGVLPGGPDGARVEL